MTRYLKDSYLLRCEDAESRNAITRQLNKIISDVMIHDNKLCLEFEDSSKLKIWDGGQKCCEVRFMATSDNLKDIIGQKLITIELKSGDTFNANENTKNDIIETSFLNVCTDKDVLEIVTYNHHNGYYGGFHIKASN